MLARAPAEEKCHERPCVHGPQSILAVPCRASPSRSWRATAARALGVLRTPHGEVETPVFMPVGTAGAVKAVLHRDLREMGARMLLANTYHLMLRPGDALVAQLGGLHGFMGWQGPFLTDSGGYQVFSLAALRKLDEEGVRFQSHIDGSAHLLTPERSMQIQQNLGADIAMAFDECPPGDSAREVVAEATARTTRWARRSRAAHTRADQWLFGIVQGGVAPRPARDERPRADRARLPRLRRRRALGRRAQARARPRARAPRPRAAAGQAALPDGRRHAGGPRRLGGPRHRHVRLRAADAQRAKRPAADLRAASSRSATRATATTRGRPTRTVSARRAAATSRAYLRHLHLAGEMSAATLASVHNLFFYVDMMRNLRQSIRLCRFEEWRKDTLRRLEDGQDGS